MNTILSCLICKNAAIFPIDRTANLWRCGMCGYMFVNPQPSHEELARFYSQASKYDGWLGQEKARDALWKRRLRVIARYARGGSLLDVGTGIGQFLAHARQVFSEVAGTEISDSAIGIARKKYGLLLHQGTVEQIDFNGKQFDVITLFHVLEHVHDPPALIADCARLLTVHGVLVVAVPNEIHSARRRMAGYLKLLLNAAGSTRYRLHGRFGIPRISFDGSQDEIHLSFFTERSLRYLLRHYGFTIERTTLDPSYAVSGPRLFFETIYWKICEMLHVFGPNAYETILVVAKKDSQHRIS
jgi:SAM-dependent methyltransferase